MNCVEPKLRTLIFRTEKRAENRNRAFRYVKGVVMSFIIVLLILTYIALKRYKDSYELS